jgi:hypothetical protein
MGGGLMQLVAYGAQDIYLTGNPQITFFKVVYRRHTNFAMESVEQTMNGSSAFGGKAVATVSRNGDLVGRMYVEADVTAMTAGTNIQCNPGSALLTEVTCEIGGQQIDKHYGHWLETWSQLTESNPTGAASTMTNATGNLLAVHTSGTTFQNMSGMGGVNGYNTHANVVELEKIFVPLQFWFNRNPGLALPLIALQYHEVKITIQFGNVGDLTSADGTLNASLWADYIYLDTDERRRFAQVSHEYLIEQLQYQNFSDNSSMDLTFNHPVKELIWTGAVTNSATATAGPSTPTAVETNEWKLVLNGHDRFAARNSKYFTRTQIWQHHTGHGGVTNSDSIAVYSFALKPEEHQPSGTCNFSRIDNAQLRCIDGSDETNVYAVNYNVLRVMSGMGGLAYSN